MSLTSFVSTDVVRDEIDSFASNHGERATNNQQCNWNTSNYTLVGTAVDYLVRFWLRRHTDTCYTRRWIAYRGAAIASQQYPEYADDIEATLADAHNHVDEYLETGTLTRPLIESAFDLARLDAVYRNGAEPTTLGSYNDDDIVDCIELLAILDDSGALDGETVILNPEFGAASDLVGAADGDVILDNTLVDIKTTGRATFKVGYWRQLVGYLVLCDIHSTLQSEGVYDELGYEDATDIEMPPIERFGVYFARHGELSTVQASLVYDHDDYPEFRQWFISEAQSRFPSTDLRLQAELDDIFS